MRIRTRPEYVAVQTHGRRVSGRFLTLVGQPNSFAHDRLGIIASRRLGGAVVRNRAKRRIRALFRAEALVDAAASGTKPFDVVVIPRRELVTVASSILKEDFAAALRKLRGKR